MTSHTINNIIPAIQGFLATQPISKAWLFGSYSRGEETKESDVDILVFFEEGTNMSLFKYALTKKGIYILPAEARKP